MQCDICLTFLFKFWKLFLHLFFIARPNLFSSKKPKPTSSSPISASHEPGVKGVTRAARPRIISMTPMIFFRIGFIRNLFCVFPFWFFCCYALFCFCMTKVYHNPRNKYCKIAGKCQEIDKYAEGVYNPVYLSSWISRPISLQPYVP